MLYVIMAQRAKSFAHVLQQLDNFSELLQDICKMEYVSAFPSDTNIDRLYVDHTPLISYNGIKQMNALDWLVKGHKN